MFLLLVFVFLKLFSYGLGCPWTLKKLCVVMIKIFWSNLDSGLVRSWLPQMTGSGRSRCGCRQTNPHQRLTTQVCREKNDRRQGLSNSDTIDIGVAVFEKMTILMTAGNRV